jgi:hypothetical protein
MPSFGSAISSYLSDTYRPLTVIERREAISNIVDL